MLLLPKGPGRVTDIVTDMVEKDCVSVSSVTSGDGEQTDMSVSLVEKDRMSFSSVNSGDDEQIDMSLELSRFQPLNHPTSPVHIGDSQVVVESPSHYEVLAVPVAISALLDSVAQMPQTGYVRIVHPRLLTCFQCIRCLRLIPDTYLRRHQLHQRFPGIYRLL